jgi:hypothetical protein
MIDGEQLIGLIKEIKENEDYIKIFKRKDF